MRNRDTLHLAICKAIVGNRRNISEEKLIQCDIVRLSDMLISRIWPLHDFGDWSRRWIWLDGPAGVTAIREFDSDSLAVTGLWYVMGKKTGSNCPNKA